MSPVLIATIAGLITALCWGTGDWLTAKSSKKLDPYAINFVVQAIGAAIMVVVMLVSHTALPSTHLLLVILAIAVLFSASYLLFIKALSSGAVGIIVPLANGYPVITLTLAVVVLDNTFSANQIIAMLAIVLGAVLLAYEKNHANIPAHKFHRATFLAVTAASMWGVGFFLVDTIAQEVSWQALTGFMDIFMLGIAGILLMVTNRSKALVSSKRAFVSSASVAGLMFVAGSMAFYFGTDHAGSVVIPTVISAGGPLVASILGAVVDKEKIGVLKRAGALVVIAGIIALNVL